MTFKIHDEEQFNTPLKTSSVILMFGIFRQYYVIVRNRKVLFMFDMPLKQFCDHNILSDNDIPWEAWSPF